MTEPTAKAIRKRGPYLEYAKGMTILYVPAISGHVSSEDWVNWLNRDGFTQVDAEMWADYVGATAEAELVKWQARYDAVFPGIREIDAEEDAWRKAQAARDVALPSEPKRRGRSKLFQT